MSDGNSSLLWSNHAISLNGSGHFSLNSTWHDSAGFDVWMLSGGDKSVDVESSFRDAVGLDVIKVS
tara:strand:- start:339 stop:536 length:198 start_codon:yes stop_codon:yes gene_type:complete